MRKLYVWSGDEVPGCGIMCAWAESIADAMEDVTLSIVGSTMAADVAEFDLGFLLGDPDVYLAAVVGGLDD